MHALYTHMKGNIQYQDYRIFVQLRTCVILWKLIPSNEPNQTQLISTKVCKLLTDTLEDIMNDQDKSGFMRYVQRVARP